MALGRGESYLQEEAHAQERRAARDKKASEEEAPKPPSKAQARWQESADLMGF